MNAPPAWVGVVLVLAVLGGALVCVARFARGGRISAEARRKSIHVTLGCVTVTFPWLFGTQRIPVLVLGAFAVITLAWLRWLRGANDPARQVLHGVARESYGELCFPVAVALAFAISAEMPAYYVASILVLTFADTAGAIVGVRWGRKRLAMDEGTKSLEGSVAVFVTAFVCVGVPLQWVGEWDRGNILLAATHAALLLALLEGVAMRGFDNLFIPLLTLIVLFAHEQRTATELGMRLAVLTLLLVAGVFWRRRTLLNHAGLIGATLVLYLCWVAGGWRWMIAPLVTGCVYAALVAPARGVATRVHRLIGVLTVSGAGLAWMLAAMERPDRDWTGPFVVSFATQVTLMAVAEWSGRGPMVMGVAGAALLSGLITVLGALPWMESASGVWILGGASVAIGLVAGAMFHALEFRRAMDHNRDMRWILQGTLGAGASLLALLL